LFLIHFTIHESLICFQFFVHLSVPKTQRAFKISTFMSSLS